MKIDAVESENLHFLKQKITNFTSGLAIKWQGCNRTFSNFENKYSGWLNEMEVFSMKNISNEPQPEPSSSKSRGPYKPFKELTHVSKKRKIKPLTENYSQEELCFAARVSLLKSGRRDTAEMIKEVTDHSPARATKIKKTWKSPLKQPIKYTPEEALALYIDGKFSKHSYKLMQLGAKVRHANIYPSYDIILKAKKACYPAEESMAFTDGSATVKIQALVDHTSKRLLLSIKDLIFKKAENIGNEIVIIYKWGCDGSSGHSLYKQTFSDSQNVSSTDEFIFSVCLVPLQMKSLKDNAIVWQNPKPSSTRFCRPIKVIFQKETKNLIKTVADEIEREIKDIQPTHFDFNDTHFIINHSFKLTMINGKVFSILTDSSFQSCAICGASPKIMNDIKKVKKLTKAETLYEYGISSLHAWIRCLECLLHIAYRLDVKKWQIRKIADKNIVETTKNRIQKELKLKLGLLVDVVKPGFGTTNDGNTASRFFENYKVTAQITGLDESFIKRIKVILQVISCGQATNIDAFRKYLEDTANLYVKLYPWYYMPASLHKLLIHGADIVESASLPIGMLSEEALEARNKDLRKYRECHTRKFSRLQTIIDLFHTLLYSSDPLISNMSKKTYIARPLNINKLDEDVLRLLSEPNDVYLSEDSDSEPNVLE